ncbi:hypothetical protein SRB5_58440 [Streptomyces sp. RB5]|uniref:VWFA domain-containing protein n=1 Tax=Streptomyces smaragdinus TaxID=2585196 RepID=A0A7K0CQA1_9ACTN|nr:SpaA isopeptide-forming pilin-related protein [Streptomyces smaragdinus]MQY15656.1 hypothetical protein [Streptomyces smaragdinus]
MNKRFSAYRSAAGVALMTAVTLLSGSLPQAQAATDPTDGTAVIRVHVGGDRTGGGVDPLAGAVLGLSTEAGGEVGRTCTSDAEGLCEFILPTAETGRSYVVRQVSAPDGWVMNPELRTGPSGAGGQARAYEFPTPVVWPGNLYESGSNDANGFMRFAERLNGPHTDSTGVWQNSRANPPLPELCGLRVALIMDWSTSVGGDAPQLRSAADALVDGLRGTPSSMSVFHFSTTSPRPGIPNRPQLTPVSSANGAQEIKDSYRTITPGGSTNWDAAFRAAVAANGDYDLAVMITDGNPTSRGPTGQATGRTNRFAEVEDGIFSANALKEQGTRVVAMGVGSGVEEASSALNLAAISGPVRFTDDVGTADYFQDHDYGEAAQHLRALALQHCPGTMHIVKQIVPPGGTLTDAVPAGPGWTFTVDGTGLPDALERTTSTDRTGAVQYDLTGSTAENLDLDVTGDQHEGYERLDVDGRPARCTATPITEEEVGEEIPLDVSPGTTGEAFHVAGVPAAGTTTCTVYNQAPEGVTELTVDKRWSINGTTFPHGGQPVGLDAELQLTDPAGDLMPEAEWGETYGEYTAGDQVAVGEDTEVDLPRCRPERGATITGVDGEAVPLQPGHKVTLSAVHANNRFTITNYLTCDAGLTLRKEVHGGPADPADWLLTATAREEGPLPGPSGNGTATADVTPEVSYVLGESGGDPRYAPADSRTMEGGEPLEPGTTASWTCELDGDASTGGWTDGVEGVVSVPLGHDATCTLDNTVATVRVAKRVTGGDAVPSDFTLIFTPVGDNLPEGLEPVVVPGSAEPVPMLLRPGIPYRVSELGVPNYRPSLLTCEPSHVQTAGLELTATPADIEAVNVTCTLDNGISEDPVSDGVIELRKRDSADGSPLAGAVFRLWLETNGVEGLQTDGDNPDTPHDTGCSTDTTGVCRWENLPVGFFYLQETAVPEGYVLPEGRVLGPFRIQTGSAPIEVGADNERDTCEKGDKRPECKTR